MALAGGVNALRKQWPQVRIIYRADGGFYRHKVFNWCERYNVEYIVGLWVSGTPNNGFYVRADQNQGSLSDYTVYHSSEWTGTSDDPYLIVYYH